MKDNKHKKAGKRVYKKPEISKIAVDNEISMVMMSPPGDPFEFSFGTLSKIIK
jgi:hypothetical protein